MNAIPPHVLEDFKEGFDDERYLVDAIKRYLLTPEQKALLNSRDISIEYYLNGRIEGEDQDEIYISLANDWNNKLGFPCFGHPLEPME